MVKQGICGALPRTCGTVLPCKAILLSLASVTVSACRPILPPQSMARKDALLCYGKSETLHWQGPVRPASRQLTGIAGRTGPCCAYSKYQNEIGRKRPGRNAKGNYLAVSEHHNRRG